MPVGCSLALAYYSSDQNCKSSKPEQHFYIGVEWTASPHHLPIAITLVILETRPPIVSYLPVQVYVSRILHKSRNAWNFKIFPLQIWQISWKPQVIDISSFLSVQSGASSTD